MLEDIFVGLMVIVFVVIPFINYFVLPAISDILDEWHDFLNK